jgi:hypothetical protein
MEVRVSTADVAEVALEVLDVYGVEADDGCVQTDVLLRQAVAKVERTTGLCEVCFRAV